MNNRSSSFFAALGLIAVMVGGNQALAQERAVATTMVAAQADRAAEGKMRSAAAQSARSLQSSPDDARSLAAALKGGDDAQAKAILQKHGFTPEQLEGARIVLNEVQPPRDNGSGPAARRKITIGVGVSFKPLTITVTVSF